MIIASITQYYTSPTYSLLSYIHNSLTKNFSPYSSPNKNQSSMLTIPTQFIDYLTLILTYNYTTIFLFNNITFIHSLTYSSFRKLSFSDHGLHAIHTYIYIYIYQTVPVLPHSQTGIASLWHNERTRLQQPTFPVINTNQYYIG